MQLLIGEKHLQSNGLIPVRRGIPEDMPVDVMESISLHGFIEKLTEFLDLREVSYVMSSIHAAASSFPILALAMYPTTDIELMFHRMWTNNLTLYPFPVKKVLPTDEEGTMEAWIVMYMMSYKATSMSCTTFQYFEDFFVTNAGVLSYN